MLVGEHQEPAQVFELYRAADFCVVNCLSDKGMNLVARIFVSARVDEDASDPDAGGRVAQNVEALLVNPFDIGETADAIRVALEIPDATSDERRPRLRLMPTNSVKNKAGLPGAGLGRC